MHIAYIGNFEPEHSTENEIRRALENNGHTVLTFQEGEPLRLIDLSMCLRHPTMFDDGDFDLVMWTRTGGLAAKSGEALYWKMLATARQAKVPVVGYHLDRWWGLRRQAEIEMDPFFRVDLLVTADGGHDDQWESVGVKHVWFPPAISERHCHLGTPRPQFESDIAFVGSWQAGYHDEWGHRAELVRWLQKNYDRRVEFWPKPGNHAIRGSDLNDLYASVKVVVGDSCLVPKPDGSPMTHYCSDRVPETLGRGGILLHPKVEGIDTLLGSFVYGWELDNWEYLRNAIDNTLWSYENPEKSVFAYSNLELHRRDQIAHVREHHTYEVRMRQLVDVLTERALLR